MNVILRHVTDGQMLLIRTVAAGDHPLAGLAGRVVGATVRNLETLRRRGFLRHHGRSASWHVTPKGRRAMTDGWVGLEACVRVMRRPRVRARYKPAP